MDKYSRGVITYRWIGFRIIKTVMWWGHALHCIITALSACDKKCDKKALEPAGLGREKLGLGNSAVEKKGEWWPKHWRQQSPINTRSSMPPLTPLAPLNLLKPTYLSSQKGLGPHGTSGRDHYPSFLFNLRGQWRHGIAAIENDLCQPPAQLERSIYPICSAIGILWGMGGFSWF